MNEPLGFADARLPQFSVAILGDLHLEPDQMPLFRVARDQLLQAMQGPDGRPLPGARVVQLGDLGGYNHQPGSWQCFKVARDYLDGFGVPVGLITGNHDLEGTYDFDTDEANLAAWQQVFQQRHYWSAELGPALLVGLSTVRFRSNTFSVHEVYVDDEQLDWFEALVASNPERPIVVFTHAPPQGSGLKVVQNVHVKNRCAWLNHSDRPRRFINLVQRHHNIRLWFSGHFHLSQNYPDSITGAAGCSFVQTGVIGECNRDDNRQSRILTADATSFKVLTLDHITGKLRTDLVHAWEDTNLPVPSMPEHTWQPEARPEWLSSSWDCALGPETAQVVRWFPAGGDCLLAVQDDLLMEYDLPSRAPIGLVAEVKGRKVSVVAADGLPPRLDDGSDVAAVLLTHPTSGEVTRLDRQEGGSFFRIFQPNKWKLKQLLQKEQEALKLAPT